MQGEKNLKKRKQQQKQHPITMGQYQIGVTQT